MRVFLSVLFGLFLLSLPSFALERPAPATVILTVDGAIGPSNSPDGIEFDATMLRAIGWREVTTYSPFLEGEQSFGGVPVSDFLSYLEVEEGTLQALALDGYQVSIPVEELAAWDALLAMEHDGRVMRVRNRGPIWLIFPMTAEQAAAGDGEGRMIWQLRAITVTQ